MNFLKNNKKIIAAFAAGVIITGGAAFAANQYFASDIQYTKSGASSSMSVAEALNELYDMKKNYVLPSGTKTINEKNSLIDVSGFKYADTSGMYTESEYNSKTGENTYWKQGKNIPANPGGYVDFEIPFKPSKLFFEGRYVNNNNLTCYLSGCLNLNFNGSYILNDVWYNGNNSSYGKIWQADWGNCYSNNNFRITGVGGIFSNCVFDFVAIK